MFSCLNPIGRRGSFSITLAYNFTKKIFGFIWSMIVHYLIKDHAPTLWQTQDNTFPFVEKTLRIFVLTPYASVLEGIHLRPSATIFFSLGRRWDDPTTYRQWVSSPCGPAHDVYGAQQWIGQRNSDFKSEHILALAFWLLDVCHFASNVMELFHRFKLDHPKIASSAQIPTLGLRRGQGGRDHIQVALAWEDKEDL